MILGDRVFIRSLKVDGGDILVELDTTGTGDAACCPTDSKRYSPTGWKTTN